jgi:lactate permease
VTWTQVYNPPGNLYVSALVAAIPVVVLLGSLPLLHVKAHMAAILRNEGAVFVFQTHSAFSNPLPRFRPRRAP